MRALVAIALLATACDSAALQPGGDASGAVDGSTDGADLSSIDLSSVCVAQSGACDFPADQWCDPFRVGSEEVCFCTEPGRFWYCCHPEIWQCPASPRTGDPCCQRVLGGSGRVCGNCTCVHEQFQCSVDGGAAD